MSETLLLLIALVAMAFAAKAVHASKLASRLRPIRISTREQNRRSR
jgi:hypothetical protein